MKLNKESDRDILLKMMSNMQFPGQLIKDVFQLQLAIETAGIDGDQTQPVKPGDASEVSCNG